MPGATTGGASWARAASGASGASCERCAGAGRGTPDRHPKSMENVMFLPKNVGFIDISISITSSQNEVLDALGKYHIWNCRGCCSGSLEHP